MLQDHFYADLPLNKLTLGDLLIQAALFEDVPNDWHVVITDIKNSTTAVFNGQHENVNLVATGSIVAVLNLAYKAGVTIPFFFGGDGATFIVPPSLIAAAMQALALYKINTLNNFNLEIRTGTITVAEIYAAGHGLRMAKFKSSSAFFIPVILGNGLNYAEKIIKGVDYLSPEQPENEMELDLSGMQCRWDKIAPPDQHEEIVTLLVIASNSADQSAAFRKVMNKLDELYGLPPKRQPISVPKLRFKTTFSKLGAEMRARLGKIKIFEFLQTYLTNLYGYIYFRTASGKKYLESLVQMSDTLVIDGKINTVISGISKQRALLQKFLDQMETAGEIIYGLHVSNASVMSCYVRDLEDGHIHFVDGAEGGYTQAAKILKAKLVQN